MKINQIVKTATIAVASVCAAKALQTVFNHFFSRDNSRCTDLEEFDEKELGEFFKESIPNDEENSLDDITDILDNIFDNLGDIFDNLGDIFDNLGDFLDDLDDLNNEETTLIEEESCLDEKELIIPTTKSPSKPKGSKRKKSEICLKVERWQKKHPDGRKCDCMRDTGVSETSLYKYWKDNIKQEETP